MRLSFLIPLARAIRRRCIQRVPDVIIGSQTPYMLRWWVIPRNTYPINIYLHHFLRRDEDRALHDHPWWSISFIFEGRYFEHTEEPGSLQRDGYIHRTMVPVTHERKAGQVAWRGALSRHRISLPTEPAPPCREVPCWTIFITGPKVREWGFICKGQNGKPDRWVPWRTFTSSDHNVTGVGSIGAGCGED